MEQNSSPAVSEISSYPFSNVLPVCIYDCYDIWPSLNIDIAPLLDQFEWQWTSNGNVVSDSSSSIRLYFHLIRTPTLYHPATASAYWHLNPYAHVFLIPVQLLGQSEHCNRIRHFVQSCRDLNRHFLVICITSGNELYSYKKNFEHLTAEIAALSRASDKLVVLSTDDHNKKLDTPSNPESDTCRSFLSYIKELVHDSVQHRLNAYEQQSFHLWKNRATSNWTHARFFAVKESLAYVFCHLGRRDFSVKQYETLHNLLLTTDFRQKPDAHFSDLPPADAAKGLSDPEFRDYRVKLLDGSISELDLHTYVFACQMTLLLQDRKYTQLAEKAVKLISYVNRRCSEFQHSLTTPLCSIVFRDIWVFTACRHISATLAPAIPQSPVSKGAGRFHTSRERHTVRVLAGFHVHALRALQNLSNITLPGCLSPETSVSGDKEALLSEVLSTTNDKLRTALSNRTAAEQLHSEIAYAAAGLYEMGCRSRGAASLDADAGRVHLRNGSYAEAESLLRAQCTTFMNNRGWDVLHHRERADLANAENHLGRAQDYLLSCLTMVCMCRTSRSFEIPPTLLPGDLQSLRESATFWFSEATKTAQNLSRMIKYKAERLFCISVLPNLVSWEDGSAGSATVRVKSDISAPLLVDYVSAECKCLEVLSTRRSMLTRRQEQFVSSEGPISSHLDHSTPSPTSPSTSDNGIPSEVVMLKSNPKIVIAPGINDIPLYTDEMPHYGRYWVSSIMLYLGQLKIVQIVSKPSSNMVTSTQTGVSKPTIASSTSSPLLDFAVFGAYSPFFFASNRVPSAVISIEPFQTLYVLPHFRQPISIKIKALERGIATGSNLDCYIIRPKISDADKAVLWPMKGTLGLNILDQENQKMDDVVLKAQYRVGDVFNAVEGTITKDMNDGEALTAQVSLNVEEFSLMPRQNQSPSGISAESCRLHAALTWNELEGNTGRRFHCDVLSKLIFVPPVNIEGLVQYRATRMSESRLRKNVKQDEAGDMEYCGTALFFIRRPAISKEAFQISSIVLDLSPNLRHVADDDSPLNTLLPFTLTPKGTFVCSFKFLVNHDQLINSCVSEGAKADITKHHQISDKASRTPTGVSGTPAGLTTEAGLAVQKYTEHHPHLIATPPHLNNPNVSFLQNDTSTFTSPGKSVSTERGVSVIRPLEGRRAAVQSNYDDMEFLNGNIVLSETERSHGDSGSDTCCNSLHVGTLKIRLGIQGSGESVYQRRVDVKSPERLNELTVERKMNFIGEVGKTTHVTVRVRNKSGPHKDIGLIYFEVDADPSVWLVIGRRSGKIRLTVEESKDNCETGIIKLMAVRCGVHAVPKVNLFPTEGRKVSWDYDDTSSIKSVLILPSVSVTGACSSCEVRYSAKEQLGNSEGNAPTHKWMPVVIASDSFFSRG